MPISSLVVTLQPQADSLQLALARFATDLTLTVGEAQGLRIPVVLETSSLTASREKVEALQGLPEVAFVDVVAVNFEDLHTSPDALEMTPDGS